MQGLLPALLGMSVAFKQLVPEHVISLVPGVAVRSKDVPFLSWLAAVVFLVMWDGVVAAVYASAGLYFAWFYLRFYKVRATPRAIRRSPGGGTHCMATCVMRRGADPRRRARRPQ